jgi:hypothetical protein
MAEVFLKVLYWWKYLQISLSASLHEITATSRYSFDSNCCMRITVIPIGEMFTLTYIRVDRSLK